MNKETSAQNVQLPELDTEELAEVAGGARWINVYSNGGFYSGANVNSFKQKSKRKR